MFKHNDSLLFLNCTPNPTIKKLFKAVCFERYHLEMETKENMGTELSVPHNSSFWWNVPQQRYKELVAIAFGDGTHKNICHPHPHPMTVVAKFNPESYCWIFFCMKFVKVRIVSQQYKWEQEVSLPLRARGTTRASWTAWSYPQFRDRGLATSN